MNKSWLIFPFIFYSSLPLTAQEIIDTSVIHAIKTEAFHHSRVMEHAFWLTEVNGPRLTGSKGYFDALTWAEKNLTAFGLDNIQHESFSWGRGWTPQNFHATLDLPQFAPLIGYPLPWSPSTDGMIKNNPVLAPIPDYPQWSDESLDAYFREYRGKLRHRIVLIESPGLLKTDSFFPDKRYSQEELNALIQPWPQPSPSPAPIKTSKVNIKPFEYYAERFMEYYRKENVSCLVLKEWGKGGGVMVLSHAFGANWLHFNKYPPPPPMIGLSHEHYNRIARLLQHNIETLMSIDVKSELKAQVDTYNLTAEIPGSDKKDEVVMLGAHLDSWTPSTGATDNAAGVAVMMEAMRILKKLNLHPRRTIRIALWGGHEGEGTGAKTYVRQHFGTAGQPTARHKTISCYFNLDNGTGKIRGIYVNRNEALLPIFRQWFVPFHSMGANAVSINIMTGTDHVAFEQAGIPGFQFIQDPINYNPVTHHTNMDSYDQLSESDLQQAATIVASFVYMAAMRNELLPRKSLK